MRMRLIDDIGMVVYGAEKIRVLQYYAGRLVVYVSKRLFARRLPMADGHLDKLHGEILRICIEYLSIYRIYAAIDDYPRPLLQS